MQRWLVSLVAVCSAATSQAQIATNYIIDQFDSPGEIGYYQDAGWNGGATASFSFSSSNATTSLVPNNAGSGSMEWQVYWTGTAGQDVAGRTSFNTLNSLGDVLNLVSAGYTNLSFDIQFQPDCATDGAGSYGNLEVEYFTQTAGWYEFDGGTYASSVANSNGWIHVNLPINPNALTSYDSLTNTTGIGLKIQQNKTGNNIVGTTDFLIDNLILTAGGPPPPPVVSIAPTQTYPGLLFVSSGGGNQYNRTLLEATDPTSGLNFSWIGAGNTPVTYAMTITNFPGTNYPGLQAVMFLVPSGGNEDPAVDYDAADLLQLVVQENTNGSAMASVQYKTNQPGGNSQLSGTGNLGSLMASSPLGTWSLTFLNDTNIIIKGPGGVSTNLNLPNETTAQMFVNPLTLYFGTQQGGITNNIGQGVTFSEFSVTNTSAATANPSGAPGAVAFDDIFTNDDGTLPDYWIVDSPSAPNNILYVNSGGMVWVNWTLPASGFGLESTSSLTKPIHWTPVPSSPIVTTSYGDEVLLPIGTNQTYFNMVNSSQ